MSRFHLTHAAVIAATVTALAACSKDSSPPKEGQVPEAGDLTALQTEYHQLQQRLGPIQQQAMQDSVLKAEFTQLGNAVDSAMTSIDPQIPAHRERITAIQTELQNLGTDADSAKVQALLEEGTSLQMKIRQAQAAAVQDESLAARMSAFQDSVVAKMTEIDPQAASMVDRIDSLSNRIRAMGHPAGQAGGQ